MELLDDINAHVTDGDLLPFGDFCPFAGFDSTVSVDMAVCDEKLGLSAGVDQIEHFDQLIQLNGFVFKGIGHE